MNNYVNGWQKRVFIKNYKIDNNTIIVTTSSKNEYKFSYSEIMENNIIKAMEKQAKNAFKFPILDKIMAIGFPISFVAILLECLAGANPICWSFLAIICLYIRYPINFIRYLTNKKELKKIKYFLDNKEQFNEIVRDNPEIKKELGEKATKQVEKIPYQKPVVNINVIDNYSLSDLKKLAENMKKIKSFEYFQNEFNEEEKSKTKTFKK